LVPCTLLHQATSVSHSLADYFEEFGGIVHQAEDEIAAIGVAIGSNFVGKTSSHRHFRSRNGFKTEFQSLAVMTETPLVIVDVQRGGPSTGLPTKVEQSDLLSSLFSTPGDAPKVVWPPVPLKIVLTSCPQHENCRRISNARHCSFRC